MTKTYTITTYDGSLKIEAASLAEALAQTEIPAKSAVEFEAWLKSDDSFGSIMEDGVVISMVSK